MGKYDSFPHGDPFASLMPPIPPLPSMPMRQGPAPQAPAPMPMPQGLSDMGTAGPAMGDPEMAFKQEASRMIQQFAEETRKASWAPLEQRLRNGGGRHVDEVGVGDPAVWDEARQSLSPTRGLRTPQSPWRTLLVGEQSC